MSCLFLYRITFWKYRFPLPLRPYGGTLPLTVPCEDALFIWLPSFTLFIILPNDLFTLFWLQMGSSMRIRKGSRKYMVLAANWRRQVWVKCHIKIYLLFSIYIYQVHCCVGIKALALFCSIYWLRLVVCTANQTSQANFSSWKESKIDFILFILMSLRLGFMGLDVRSITLVIHLFVIIKKLFPIDFW